MENIFEIKTGLPEKFKNEQSVLEQYRLNYSSMKQSGTRIFSDGSIYVTTIIGGENGNEQTLHWKYFTHLKSDGLEQIKKIIKSDFSKIDQNKLPVPTSQNILIWKSFLNGVQNTVKIGSGMYSNLPSAFKKIDDTINKFMVRMNEKE